MHLRILQAVQATDDSSPTSRRGVSEEASAAPVGTLALLPPDAGDAVHERPRHPVSAATLERARVFAEGLFSDERGAPDSARIEWLVRDLEDFLGRAGGNARLVLGACLFACNILAPLFIRRIPTLADLDPEARARALERVERTALGPIALAPKAILCMLWFEHPDTQRETGTEPSCLRGSSPSSP